LKPPFRAIPIPRKASLPERQRRRVRRLKSDERSISLLEISSRRKRISHPSDRDGLFYSGRI
jgi:hypothetical protein